jgi:tRNA(adenine34) deaminase
MQEAIREAVAARMAGEVPVGAVVVCDGEIVGRGRNRNIVDHDPTAHAEILALREAAREIGNHRLGGCDMFVTIEPCAMCAGALVQARIRRLVYGADDPRAGAVRSVFAVVSEPRLNHRIDVVAGVLGGKCADLVQSFFRDKREP